MQLPVLFIGAPGNCCYMYEIANKFVMISNRGSLVISGYKYLGICMSLFPFGQNRNSLFFNYFHYSFLYKTRHHLNSLEPGVFFTSTLSNHVTETVNYKKFLGREKSICPAAGFEP